MVKGVRKLMVILLTLTLAVISAGVDVSYAKDVFDITDGYHMVNSYRMSYNLKAGKGHKLKMLKRDSKLEKAAMIRAKEIVRTGKFSHIRPNGESSLSLIKGRRVRGENLGIGYSTYEKVFTAWRKSPPHRRNILNRKFRKVGIAAYCRNGRICWVQMFSS